METEANGLEAEELQNFAGPDPSLPPSFCRTALCQEAGSEIPLYLRPFAADQGIPSHRLGISVSLADQHLQKP